MGAGDTFVRNQNVFRWTLLLKLVIKPYTKITNITCETFETEVALLLALFGSFDSQFIVCK